MHAVRGGEGERHGEDGARDEGKRGERHGAVRVAATRGEASQCGRTKRGKTFK